MAGIGGKDEEVGGGVALPTEEVQRDGQADEQDQDGCGQRGPVVVPDVEESAGAHDRPPDGQPDEDHGPGPNEPLAGVSHVEAELLSRQSGDDTPGTCGHSHSSRPSRRPASFRRCGQHPSEQPPPGQGECGETDRRDRQEHEGAQSLPGRCVDNRPLGSHRWDQCSPIHDRMCGGGLGQTKVLDGDGNGPVGEEGSGGKTEDEEAGHVSSTPGSQDG